MSFITSLDPVFGTATNNNAAAGKVGEYISSAVTTAQNVPGATDTWADVTSITLTPGDWDVSASLVTQLNGASGVNSMLGGIGTAAGSDVTGLVVPINTLLGAPPTNTNDSAMTIPTNRVSIASNTTLYLKLRVSYSSGTPKCFGFIGARRVR